MVLCGTYAHNQGTGPMLLLAIMLTYVVGSRQKHKPGFRLTSENLMESPLKPIQYVVCVRFWKKFQVVLAGQKIFEDTI